MNPWDTPVTVESMVDRIRELSPRVEQLARAVAIDRSALEERRSEIERACGDVAGLQNELARAVHLHLPPQAATAWSETQLDAAYLEVPIDDATSLRLGRFLSRLRART